MKLHYGLDDLKDIDFMAILPIILPIIIVGTILILIAFIDLYRYRKTRENIRIWIMIILFANTLGPILYFAIGRKDCEKFETRD
ncbi:PLD nuclease N-terminal domain-containing protein [Priestia endophytica]|uniref:PLD nuclease N-terminal domain-containing protein n=1 Tax=Priestia endophytica TaxID=135735 RepID=UPI002E1DAA00|nr:PLD nuclease N-terminal domain-containing protein [Priestia endophytica]